MFVLKTTSSVGNSAQGYGERPVEWDGMRLALPVFLAMLLNRLSLSPTFPILLCDLP